jgi:hypothetical protein
MGNFPAQLAGGACRVAVAGVHVDELQEIEPHLFRWQVAYFTC